MKISIIIPTVGRDTLERVLHGILNSSGYSIDKTEIIVIFNGSHNQLPIVPKEVRLIELPEKVWAGEARNKGIDEATGDVIVFLGDDTVPGVDWLARVHSFHTENPYKECVLLGMIAWDFEYQEDPFYRWLLNNAQFAFRSLRFRKPDWRYFYTANISMKRELVGTERFSDIFEGWGFEDSEFGYRLQKKGMRISFDRSCVVYHDHVMTMEDVIKRTHSARKNAERFEQLHPGVKVLPSKMEKVLLQFMIWFSVVFSWMPQVRWWRKWKKAWLGQW